MQFKLRYLIKFNVKCQEIGEKPQRYQRFPTVSRIMRELFHVFFLDSYKLVEFRLYIKYNKFKVKGVPENMGHTDFFTP